MSGKRGISRASVQLCATVCGDLSGWQTGKALELSVEMNFAAPCLRTASMIRTAVSMAFSVLHTRQATILPEPTSTSRSSTGRPSVPSSNVTFTLRACLSSDQMCIGAMVLRSRIAGCRIPFKSSFDSAITLHHAESYWRLVVARLKQGIHASTDQELAEKPSLGRSTVTSWRRRGSVTERYAELADGEAVTAFGLPWTYWAEDENAG